GGSLYQWPLFNPDRRIFTIKQILKLTVSAHTAGGERVRPLWRGTGLGTRLGLAPPLSGGRARRGGTCLTACAHRAARRARLTAAAGLARAGWRTADRTHKPLLGIVCMGDEATLTPLAIRKLQQVAVKEADKHPCPRKAQDPLFPRRGTQAGIGLFGIKAVCLHQSARLFGGGVRVDVAVDAVEHRGMYVRQPGHEPIDGERRE